MAKKTTWTLQKTLPYLLVIGGFIGLFAAFILTLEKVALLKNPNYIPTCNISPLISCGSVIKSTQASVFGFPNPLMGIFGFGVVITVGMALLAGAKFKRWFWLGLQAGTIFGVLFVHWLIFQSVYSIGALCPYCMVVWAVTLPLFLYTTMYNVREGHIKVPARLKKISDFKQRHHGDILVLWYLIIIGLILNHFWYYWKTLI